MKKTLLLLTTFFYLSFAYSQEKGIGDDDHNIIPVNRPVIYLSYDDAGNQVQRFYCATDGSCQIPDPPTKTFEEETEETSSMEQQDIADFFTIYPNPTKGPLLIKWEQAVKDQIQAIKIIGYHTPYNRPIVFDENNLFAEIDLSNELSSIYIVQFFLADGQIISKKIIKD